MKHTRKDGTPFSKEEFLQKLKIDKEFNKEFGGNGIDQIANMIDKLKNSPDDRRNMVTAWNPSEIEAATLPPCHYGFQVWTREIEAYERENWYAENQGYSDQERVEMHPNHTDDEVHQKMNDEGVPTRAISLMWNQRSCDTPLGIPFNIASYGALLQILGETVNMVPDELIGNLGDTHIYLNQVDAVKEQLKRGSHDLPQLKISRVTEVEDPSELKYEDFELLNYKSEDKLIFELSN